MLCDVSQNYVRSLFVRAKRETALYFSIPQRRRIGKVRLRVAESFGDLLISYRGLTGERRLLVEVKNHREQFDVTSGIFSKLIANALEENLAPVLVAAHLAPRALRFCHAVGIAAHSLGRQLLRTVDEPRARDLWPDDYDDRFQFIRPDRPFAIPNRPTLLG